LVRPPFLLLQPLTPTATSPHIVLTLTLAASLVYYAEQSNPDTLFISIPDSFWWAIITMCTVGYGDFAPSTAQGRVVGGVCALCGILVLALPVPFFVNNFTRLYEESIERAKRKEEAHAYTMKAIAVRVAFCKKISVDSMYSCSLCDSIGCGGKG
jgi:hypothetical protein